ncbi:secretion-regulating guanine nucleotide exchange factor [Condylostylus longicornis]|uniref:secretion-regulating guanine nucleotide exchange factor n=1 Tax=Condylostylus longicornis TaxID=2530218 RepID=UPI00244DB494|nr:secretion-regulating guanine nucleotide exchange factor [Condylostylus longicornis]
MAVFSWGANSHGQLGLGYESELCMTPQNLDQKSLQFNPNNIRSIKGGGGHILVLDNFGQVFSCGWNNRGQLGLGNLLDTSEHCNKFTQIPNEFFNDSKVHKIACGWDISGVITLEKNVYVWGSNSFQQLGICSRMSSITRPLKLTLPRDDEIPKKITFGLRHCCILTEDNKIYIYGRIRISEPYAPGLNISRIPFNKTEIIKVQTEMKINSIASGQNHVIITVENRTRIIGLGDNKYGQINSFDFDNRIKLATCGWTHNAILTNNNEIFLWGRNTYGQIGSNNSLKEAYHTPNKLNIPDEFGVPEKLYLGSEHGLIVTSLGKVLTWGWNEHGNCGNGTTENLLSPTFIELPSPCKVAGTGAGFCFVICEDITDIK